MSQMKPKESLDSVLSISNSEILIVDDEILNVFSLKQLIKSCSKYKVCSASNGKEAIEKVMERQKQGYRQFILIIMDLNMPIMDGM